MQSSGLVLAILMALPLPAVAAEPRIIEAVRSRDRSTVATLIAQRANVNEASADGATALHWAAHLGDLDAAEALIRAGASVNAANDLKITPLMLAAESGNAGLMERLLRAGARADAVAESGVTPLMYAARSGSVEGVRQLLDHEARVNGTESERQQTALMWAAAQRHPEVVRLLIARGADVRAKTRVRPHIVLINRNEQKTAEIGQGGFTALMFAVQNGDAASTAILLDAGADVNAAGADGNAPLVMAVHVGHMDVARLLLDRGADPNRASGGYSALHLAALRGEVDLVKRLLDRGANPDLAVTRGSPIRRFNPQWALSDGLRGATALYIAASLLELDVMRVLRAAGAKPHAEIPEGATALLAAVGQETERPLRPSDSDFVQRPPRPEEPALEAVEMLLGMGADVNHASQTGDTALHGAALSGFPKIVEYLVARGANINAKNRLGQTPLMLAKSNPAAETLRRLGASH